MKKELVAAEITPAPATPAIEAFPTVEAAKEAIERFKEIKRAVLSEEDYYELQDRELLNRRGCSVLAMLLNLSEPEPPSIEVKELERGEVLYSVRTCVESKLGRRSYGIGACSTLELQEKGPKRFHDALAKAHTRAKSRAIMDLIGGGEVTAEELAKPRPTPPPTGPAQKVTAKAEPTPTTPAAQQTKPTPSPYGVKLNKINDYISSLRAPRYVIMTEIEKRYGTASLARLTERQLEELISFADEAGEDVEKFLARLQELPPAP